ncbi:T9SS type A sorting domain-containing protein [Flammeovirga aprica]|uniref:T9SS type A sorting domain-containing protein n=1 Tax=Flammeovirga aprica JL-4 TaxID=694437 RepID=A0A7X9RW96_9BACT|nr:T9SS type A sorting domain-containing protein [Flammeovirga aprica]NME69901.1 T9SS type A sorting domain-containing protein [Flammeovirga aprica JL-4]
MKRLFFLLILGLILGVERHAVYGQVVPVDDLLNHSFRLSAGDYNAGDNSWNGYHVDGDRNKTAIKFQYDSDKLVSFNAGTGEGINKAPDYNENGFNDKPTILFDGNAAMVATIAPELKIKTKTLFVIYKVANDAPTNAFMNLFGDIRSGVFLDSRKNPPTIRFTAKDSNTSASYSVNFNRTFTGPISESNSPVPYTKGNDSFKMLEVSYFENYDGVEIDDSNFLYIGEVNQDIFVGALDKSHSSDREHVFKGEIAEILIYDDVIDANERALVRDYYESEYLDITKWYTFKHNIPKGWDDDYVWTKDPDGLSIIPNNKDNRPEAGDEIHVLNGQYVTTASTLPTLTKVVVEKGGTLDFKGDLNTFGELTGEGVVRISSDNIPVADGLTDKGFFTKDGGTLEIYGTSDITFPNNIEFNNLSVKLDDTSKKVYIQNLKLNGNIEIASGNIEFDASGDELTIDGDILIGKNGGWTYDGHAADDGSNFKVRNKILTQGNFTNFGEVNAPDLSIKAVNATSEQTFRIAADATLAQIRVEKAFKENTLYVYAENDVTFSLMATSDYGGPQDAEVNKEDDYAFSLFQGTLRLGRNITYDLKTGSGNRNINQNSRLWISGADVSMGGDTQKATALVIYGDVLVTEGTLDLYNNGVGPSSGFTLRTDGTLQVDGGEVFTKMLRTSTYGSAHKGAFIQHAGDITFKGNGDNHSMLSLPWPDNTFIMSGGRLMIEDTDGRSDKGLFIGVTSSNYNVTGGTVIIKTDEGFGLTSTAPFYNLELMELNPATGNKATVTSRGNTWNVSGADPNVVVPVQDLRVLNNFKVEALYKGGNKDIYVGGSLIIKKHDALGHDKDNFTYNRLVFNGRENGELFIDYQYPYIEEGGINYVVNRTDTRSGTVTNTKKECSSCPNGYHEMETRTIDGQEYLVEPAGSDLAEFNNFITSHFIIDKEVPEAKITIKAHPSYWRASDAAIDYSDKDIFRNHQNNSNFLDIHGDLQVLKGVLDHKDFSIRPLKGDIINYGTIGVFVPGVTASNALLKLRPANQGVKLTKPGARFGNIKMFMEGTGIEFTSDVHIDRLVYYDGYIDIGRYELEVDQLGYTAFQYIARDSNNGNAVTDPGFGDSPRFEEYLKKVKSGAVFNDKDIISFILTDGKSSSGGLKLKVDNGTWAQYYKYDGEDNTLLFPLAIKYGDTDFEYTPARLSIEDVSAIDGYISVRPVNTVLQTADNDGGNLAKVNWRVERSGFDESSLSVLPKVKWSFQVNNGADTENKFSPDANKFTLGAGNVVTGYVSGKVLSGDEKLVELYGNAGITYPSSSYQREYGEDGSVVGETTLALHENYSNNGTLGNPGYEKHKSNLNSTPVHYTQDKILITFDKVWDESGVGTEGFFALENASYTFGEQNTFEGEPTAYYYCKNCRAGISNNSDWTNEDSWYVEVGGTLIPITDDLSKYHIPGEGDVAIIGSPKTGYDRDNVGKQFKGIVIPEGYDLTIAEIRFEQQFKSREGKSIKIKESAIFKPGLVTGTAELSVDINATYDADDNIISITRPVIEGDFNSWAMNDSSVFKLQVPTGDNIEIPTYPSIQVYPRYELWNREQETDDDDLVKNANVYLSSDLKAKTLDIFKEVALYVRGDQPEGDIFIEGQIFLKNGGDLYFTDGNYNHTVEANFLLLDNHIKKNEDGSIRFENKPEVKVDRYSVSTVGAHHTMYLNEGIKSKNTIDTFDLFGHDGVGLDLIDINKVPRVSLVFNGESDGEIDLKDTDELKLYDFVVNKGSSSKVIRVEDKISFARPADGTSDEKPIQLVKGGVEFNSSNIDIDLNSGGGNFAIPVGTTLKITKNAIVRVTSDNGGIELDGKIHVNGGSLLMADAGKENYIEYGASGASTILLEDGIIKVGSQVRRKLTTTTGELNYEQTGGAFEVGSQGISSALHQERGVFEIYNEGSIKLNFDHNIGNGRSFIVKTGAMINPTIPYVNITPLSSEFSDDAKIVFELADGLSEVSTFRSTDDVNLPILLIKSGEVKLMPLSTDKYYQLAGKLQIESGATFNQNGFNVQFKNGIENDGAYIANGGKVKFNSGTQQNIDRFDNNNASSFQLNDLEVSGAGTILKLNRAYFDVESGKENGLKVEGDLTVSDNSTIILNRNHSLYLTGDFIGEGDIVSDNKKEALILNGNQTQNIRSNNINISYLKINNNSGVSTEIIGDSFYAFTINNALTLELGVLALKDNHMLLSENAEINGSDGRSRVSSFSDQNMILLSGKRRSGGVTKLFPANTATSKSFIYPLGVEDTETAVYKFTPAVAEYTTGASVYGVNVNILDKMFSPAIADGKTEADARILDYTWFLTSYDQNGDEIQINDDLNIDFELYYNELDIVNDADGTAEASYVEAVNYDKTGIWKILSDGSNIDKGDHIFKTSFTKDALHVFNNGYVAGVYMIGDPNDFKKYTIPYKTASSVDFSTEQNWSDAIWVKADGTEKSYDLLDASSNKIGEYTIFEIKLAGEDTVWTSTLVNAPEFTNILIDEGAKVILNNPLEQDVLDLRGELIFNVAIPGTKFNKVKGSGRFVRRSNMAIPDNWREFYTVDAGTLVMDFSSPNAGGIPYPLPDDFKTGEYANVKGLELMNSAYTDGDPIISYRFSDELLVLGKDGLKVGEGVKFQLESDLKTTSGGGVEVANVGELELPSGANITIDGDLTVRKEAKLTALNSSIQLGGDLTIEKVDREVDGKPSKGLNYDLRDFTLELNGTAPQTVYAKFGAYPGEYLPILKVNNTHNFNVLGTPSVVLTDTIHVGDALQLISGTVNSTDEGFLFYDDFNNNLQSNGSGNSYVLGRSHYQVKSIDGKVAGGMIFPIGSLQGGFRPIGIGSLTAKGALPKSSAAQQNSSNTRTASNARVARSEDVIIWSVEYTHDMIDLEGSVGRYPEDITTVEEGQWHLVPLVPAGGPATVSTELNYISTENQDVNRFLLYSDAESAVGSETWTYIGNDSSKAIVGGSKFSEALLDDEHYFSSTSGDPIIFDTKTGHSKDKKGGSGSRVNTSNARTMASDITVEAMISVGFTVEELPVELIYFDAEVKDDEVELQWATASEINNEGFVIEKSRDNRNWEQAGFVEGVGNSNVNVSYTYADTDLFAGRMYYRLKQIDFDGKYEYFGPISVLVDSDRSTSDILLSPNPTNGQNTTLSLIDIDTKAISVFIYDHNGRTIDSFERETISNYDVIELNTSTLSSGVYLVKVVAGRDAFVKKLIVR